MSKWVDHDDHGVTTCRHVLRRRCPRSLPCSSGCILMQKSTSVPRCGLDGTNWICPVETIDFRRSSGFATWILHLDMDGYGIYGICQYTHIWYICIYIYIRQIASHWVASLVGSCWLTVPHCKFFKLLTLHQPLSATKNSLGETTWHISKLDSTVESQSRLVKWLWLKAQLWADEATTFSLIF